MKENSHSWQSIRDELLSRIQNKVWVSGQKLKAEETIAKEFGCARATVNRAMQDLAQSGYLTRKRKGGTYVTKNPTRKAVLSIPVIRLEIEERGMEWRYQLLEKSLSCAPLSVLAKLNLNKDEILYHIKAIHFCNNAPYVLEERWVNNNEVPDIMAADLETISANEWLVENAPFTDGDITFSAHNANDEQKEYFNCNKNTISPR